MEVLARKKSEDPEQERLRLAKDEWNKTMKSLISHLIAFKRGINGRGDPSLGIPPSNIKDPLPNEVASVLERISAEYENITNNALNIIREQESYSQSRKQSQKLSVLINTDIEKISSSWGSRFKTLFQMGDETKSIRRSLLSILVDMEKSIKSIEDSILSGSDNAINDVINKYDSLIRIFEIRFMEVFNYFLVEHKKYLEFKNEEINETEKNNEENILDSENIDLPETFKNNKETPSNLEEVKLLRQDSNYIESLYGFIKDPESKQKLKQLRRVMDRQYLEANLDPKNTESEELRNTYIVYYNDALEFAKKITGRTGNSFKEIVFAVTASIDDITIAKLAASSSNRWVKRKLLEMSWSSNQVKKLRLEIANQLELTLALLDRMMNEIEKKNLEPTSLDPEIKELKIMFKSISKMIYNLGQIHNDAARLEKAKLYGGNKEVKLKPIEEKLLNKIYNKNTIIKKYNNEIKFIKNDSEYIKFILPLILNPDDLQKLENAYSFIKRMYNDLINTEPSDVEYNESFDKYKQYYNNILKFVQKTIKKNNNSFKEIAAAANKI